MEVRVNKRATWIMVGGTMIACALTCAVYAETFSGNLLVRPDWTHKKVGATVASETVSSLFSWAHTSGATTNQMNQLWVADVTLASNAVRTINLAGGITNSFGTVLTMAEVRMLAISAASANTGTITVGGAAANTFATWAGDSSDKIVVRPGGFLLIVAPDATAYAVGANGNLMISNNAAASASFDIYIGGSDQ